MASGHVYEALCKWEMLQAARAFLAAAWQYYKNCIFTTEAKRCPAEDLLQQCYTIYERNISEDCLLFGSSIFFFLNSLTTCISQRNICSHWEQNCSLMFKKHALQSLWVSKMLRTTTSNGQSPHSLLDKTFSFLQSSASLEALNDDQWQGEPVFQVSSPFIHRGCNQETSEHCQPGSTSWSGTAVQKHMELLTTYSQWKIAFRPHLY